MRTKSRRHASAGFTLVEMLVTVAVLGIVASIAVATIASALDKAKQRATMADMRSISKAIEIYMMDTDGTPPDDSGGMPGLSLVLVPIQSQVLPETDHWSHMYSYSRNVAGGSYTLESLGKDGIDGADISVATNLDFNLDIVMVDGVFVAAPE